MGARTCISVGVGGAGGVKELFRKGGGKGTVDANPSDFLTW